VLLQSKASQMTRELSERLPLPIMRFSSALVLRALRRPGSALIFVLVRRHDSVKLQAETPFYSRMPCLVWARREQKAGDKKTARFGAHFTQSIRVPAPRRLGLEIDHDVNLRITASASLCWSDAYTDKVYHSIYDTRQGYG
jgi:hypothetical protein